MKAKLRPGVWLVLHEWAQGPYRFRLLLGGQALILEQDGKETRQWTLRATPSYSITASAEWMEAAK